MSTKESIKARMLKDYRDQETGVMLTYGSVRVKTSINKETGLRDPLHWTASLQPKGWGNDG